MYLDPPDICKLARLNRAFRHASFADFVWESKLPLNYKFLIEKALEDNKDATFVEELGMKRDIYATLCRPNLFDNGTKVSYLNSKFPLKGSLCDQNLHIKSFIYVY